VPRVVDGDNVLGTWPGRSRGDADKRRLVREIDALMRAEKRRIVIVFDGSAPPGVSYGADVLFSGPGRKADAVILDLLRRERDVAGWTVVTSDRALADQCRWLGASIEGTRELRGKLSRDTTGEKPESADDVAYWLKEFGGGSDDT
jgi:predicted RNA-binding protein with PIN domain